MYRFSTNCQWSKSGRWRRKTSSSWSTSHRSCPKDAYRTENISSIFLTRCTHFMCRKLFDMQTISETPWRMTPKPEKRSKFRTSGGKPSTPCRSFPVSASASIYKLILFSSVCRTKGKNPPLAEAKLQAGASRAEETPDCAEGLAPAVQASAGGAEAGGVWGVSGSCWTNGACTGCDVCQWSSGQR